jgi:D-proline reductase (dithiol) PrdB
VRVCVVDRAVVRAAVHRARGRGLTVCKVFGTFGAITMWGDTSVVRLSDLPAYERQHLVSKNLAPLAPPAWVDASIPLARRRVALITTAGLHVRGDENFAFADASYRVIPGDVDASALTMSHSSVNFDRTGFQEDVNVVFPIDRLRELVRDGVVGSMASVQYSFMGAGLLPREYEASARALAGHLLRDGVDTVFLTPV